MFCYKKYYKFLLYYNIVKNLGQQDTKHIFKVAELYCSKYITVYWVRIENYWYIKIVNFLLRFFFIINMMFGTANFTPKLYGCAALLAGCTTLLN